MFKVFIVEDEPLVAEGLSLLLAETGYEVVGLADNAEDALAQLPELKPDLFIVDIRIKGKTDGIELAQMLNKRFNIPFVFLTSQTDQLTVQRALSQNPGAYIMKPYNDQEALIAVELALRNSRKTMEPEPEPNSGDGSLLLRGNLLYLRKNNRFDKLPANEIGYIQAQNNAAELVTARGRHYVTTQFGDLITHLAPFNFVRIHRSFAVNLDIIDSIEETRLFVLGAELPIGRSFKQNLFGRFFRL